MEIALGIMQPWSWGAVPVWEKMVKAGKQGWPDCDTYQWECCWHLVPRSQGCWMYCNALEQKLMKKNGLPPKADDTPTEKWWPNPTLWNGHLLTVPVDHPSSLLLVTTPYCSLRKEPLLHSTSLGEPINQGTLQRQTRSEMMIQVRQTRPCAGNLNLE